MTGLWYLVLFAFKWVFMALIYFILFILLRAVLSEMSQHTDSVSVTTSAPGRLEVRNSGQAAAAHLAPGNILELRAETTLGADPGNDIVLDESTVSRRHARLSWDGYSWSIEDLHSSNGTEVNGQPCPPGGTLPVPHGALLSLGNMQFKLLT